MVQLPFSLRYHVAAVSLNSSDSYNNTTSSERLPDLYNLLVSPGTNRYPGSSHQRIEFATSLRSGLYLGSETYSISKISQSYLACCGLASSDLSQSFGVHPPPWLSLPLVIQLLAPLIASRLSAGCGTLNHLSSGRSMSPGGGPCASSSPSCPLVFRLSCCVFPTSISSGWSLC